MSNRTTLLAILVMAMIALPAMGQVRLGVRGGVALGEMRFDRDVIDSDNRVGYSGGLMVDLAMPVSGLGIDASVMYAHRSNRLSDGQRLFKRHYISIPVMVRYRLPLPALERIVAPMVFTGPSFSVLFDDNADTGWESHKTSTSWDVGAGVDLFRHIRLTASYSLGLTRAMSYTSSDQNASEVKGKDRLWTLNLALLF